MKIFARRILFNVLLFNTFIFLIISGILIYLFFSLPTTTNAYAGYIKWVNLLYLSAAGCGAILFVTGLFLLKRFLDYKSVIDQKKHKLQLKLKKSKERLLLSTEGSGVGIWDWVPETDIVYYSPYFKKMLGFTEEEFPNSIKSFNDVMHPDDYEKVWNHIKQHLKKDIPFKIEYRLKTKSGKYRWFRAAGQSRRDINNISIRMSGSIIDIMDMKQVEERLEIQNIVTKVLSTTHTLQEASLKIIEILCKKLKWELGDVWLLDTDTNIMHCSGTWHVHELHAEAFITKTREFLFKFGEGVPGRILANKKPIWITDIAEEKLGRGFIAKEVGFHTAVGFPIVLNHEVLGVIEFFTRKMLLADYYLLDTLMMIGPQLGQFIQRKSAEIELIEMNAYNAAILESANDIIITIDENNKIISCNAQGEQALEYLPDELKGRNINIIIPNMKINFSHVIENSIFAFQAVRKDKSIFPVEIKFSKMTDVNQFVIIIRDVAERKKIENMKNEFVSVVSHELRTPLTSIRGSLGLILGGTVGEFNEKMKKLLTIANTNCERLLLLINDILDIEKIESGNMEFSNELINVTEIVKKSILINKPFFNKYGINVELIEKMPRLKIKADPDRLMQALTNLISNAVKYSFPNETVTIKIDKVSDDVQIAIFNKGPGIPLDFRSRIFQKFSQADSTNTRGKGGTGLGLCITKDIIERMGGAIYFDSIPNESTIFYIDFPSFDKFKKSSGEIKDEIKNMIKNISSYKPRLLICEDDEDQAKYLKALLEPAGFHIDIAEDVFSAKKLLKQFNYYALLLDLILPDQDGISFIRELRKDEKTHNLPIIIVSIIAKTGKNMLNGDAFAIVDWLDKPINFDQLLVSIKRIQNDGAELHVLHIDDDLDITTITKTILSNIANVDSVTHIHDALLAIKNKKYDLIILDLALPDGNGISLLPLFAKYKIPVIVYSAYELDKEHGELVKQTLIKSKTSNEKLLDTIKNALKATKSIKGEENERNTQDIIR